MPKTNKKSGKLGRDEQISVEELTRRYAALKRFVEDNWGRIGQRLPRVRTPDDVKCVLGLVPNARWSPAFRDFPAGCLLWDGSTKVSWREVRETRERHEDAEKDQGRLSLEFHNVSQAAQSAKSAFDAVVAQYVAQDSKEVQRRLKQVKEQLKVEELTGQAKELASALQAAQQNRESLDTLLKSREAWLARNEVVSFVRDPKHRYRKTPANFAKTMAGLPFYDWLYSIRKCTSIPALASIQPTYWFQTFEMLRTIVKSTRPANLRKVELKLKKKLLRQDTDPLLRAYFSPQWHFMTLALADCRGKKFRVTDIPFRIMASFLGHFDHQSAADAELAKHNQLLS